jgi:excisionase family DNA binding protein
MLLYTQGGRTMTKLYTVDEVAAILKVHRNTVIMLINTGELKAAKIGRQYRIKETDLNDYIN